LAVNLHRLIAAKFLDYYIIILFNLCSFTYKIIIPGTNVM
jgi:hypothetical protein